MQGETLTGIYLNAKSRLRREASARKAKILKVACPRLGQN